MRSGSGGGCCAAQKPSWPAEASYVTGRTSCAGGRRPASRPAARRPSPRALHPRTCNLENPSPCRGNRGRGEEGPGRRPNLDTRCAADARRSFLINRVVLPLPRTTRRLIFTSSNSFPTGRQTSIKEIQCSGCFSEFRFSTAAVTLQKAKEYFCSYISLSKRSVDIIYSITYNRKCLLAQSTAKVAQRLPNTPRRKLRATVALSPRNKQSGDNNMTGAGDCGDCHAYMAIEKY